MAEGNQVAGRQVAGDRQADASDGVADIQQAAPAVALDHPEQYN